jgi:hypothetical protein
MTEEQNKWVSVAVLKPKDGLIVMTKIDDGNGVRNEQELKRSGNLWFTPDGAIYVYYTPTHWKYKT